MMPCEGERHQFNVTDDIIRKYCQRWGLRVPTRTALVENLGSVPTW